MTFSMFDFIKQCDKAVSAYAGVIEEMVHRAEAFIRLKPNKGVEYCGPFPIIDRARIRRFVENAMTQHLQVRILQNEVEAHDPKFLQVMPDHELRHGEMIHIGSGNFNMDVKFSYFYFLDIRLTSIWREFLTWEERPKGDFYVGIQRWAVDLTKHGYLSPSALPPEKYYTTMVFGIAANHVRGENNPPVQVFPPVQEVVVTTVQPPCCQTELDPDSEPVAAIEP